MRSKGLAVFAHFIGVAVISCNKGDPAHLQRCIHHVADTLVYNLNRFLRRFEHTCMPNHIAVGKIQHNDVVFTGQNPFYNRITHLISAHFRAQIKGRHVRRFDQHTILTVKHDLLAAVEEKGHMGIFGGLCYSQLCFTRFGQRFTHGHCQRLRRKSYLHVGHRRVIFSHTDKIQRDQPFRPLKTVERRVNQRPGHFSGPVRPEVEKHKTVVGLDPRIITDYHRNHKLIGQVFAVAVHRFIGLQYRIICIISVIAGAAGDGIVGQLHPVPLGIPVHTVIPAGDSSNLPDSQFIHLLL